MSRQISIEFFTGQIGGIEAGPFGQRLCAPEGMKLVEIVPRAVIPVEHGQQQVPIGTAAARDGLTNLRVGGEALAQINLVHIAAGLDQQVDDVAFFRSQVRRVRCHLDDGQLRVLGLEIVTIGRGSGECIGRHDRSIIGNRGAGRTGEQ